VLRFDVVGLPLVLGVPTGCDLTRRGAALAAPDRFCV
jgi:hypothetical protein